MRQPTTLELTLCEGLPWGLKMIFEKSGRVINLHGIQKTTAEKLIFIDEEKYYEETIYDFKPILFPLDCLTKEITIASETFIPIDRLNEMGIVKMGLAKYRVFQAENKVHVLADLHPGYSILTDPSARSLLVQWHFNIHSLTPDQFIDADTVEVY